MSALATFDDPTIAPSLTVPDVPTIKKEFDAVRAITSPTLAVTRLRNIVDSGELGLQNWNTRDHFELAIAGEFLGHVFDLYAWCHASGPPTRVQFEIEEYLRIRARRLRHTAEGYGFGILYAAHSIEDVNDAMYYQL